MLQNAFKTAWRNISRHRLFPVINITGLAIGMAGCLLILQFVSFELSYDRFHPGSEHIYRVINDRYQNGKLVQHGPMTYSAIGKAMKDDYPEEVADYVRVSPLWSRVLIYNDKKTEESGLAVDQSFMNLFSFPLLAGNRNTVLEDPNSIILTEKLARQLAGNNKAGLTTLLGQPVQIENDSIPYKITGIFQDIPENSHLQFAFLKPYISLYQGGNGYWKSANHSFKESYFWHYILLKPGVDPQQLQSKLADFSKRHFNGTAVSGSDEKFYLQPLTQAHLYSDFENELGKTGSASMVWGLSLIAAFIIIIAWVNYVNLATAKSVDRAKEVGVRKAVGALKGQLMRLFLFESTLLNLAGLVLAIGIVMLVQPLFNALIGYQLSFGVLFNNGWTGNAIMGALVIVFLTGIFASGYYPAFVLSSFRPVAVLKGRITSSPKGISLRKFLVIGQFAITTALIIGALVVYRQINFMSAREKGINTDQVLIIKPPHLSKESRSELLNRVDIFKEEIKKLSSVQSVATSTRVPGEDLSRAFDVYSFDDSTGNKHTLQTYGVSYDFMDVYEMKLVAGRKLTRTDLNSDLSKNHNVILNEAASKLLGFKSAQHAIGKKISVYNTTYDVVGITSDFHMQSLHHAIAPMVIMPGYSRHAAFSVKLNTANISQTIATLKEKYEAFYPGNLFDYYFLDETYNQQYNKDKIFSKVFSLFTGFAIFVACLGLFGLSLYTVAQRKKEIGVRKVLGASVSNIVVLLSRDMIRLVLIANIIALPAGWWIMNNWLNDFAYRVDINWWVFAGAVVLTLIIAIGTLSFQSIKAALSNPVKSLRTE